MKISGLVTIEKSLSQSQIDVFEAFKLMKEIGTLKGKLEKCLKGNRDTLGIKSIVENGFKPNQLILSGPEFSITRSLVKVGPKEVAGYEFWNYGIKS